MIFGVNLPAFIFSTKDDLQVRYIYVMQKKPVGSIYESLRLGFGSLITNFVVN